MRLEVAESTLLGPEGTTVAGAPGWGAGVCGPPVGVRAAGLLFRCQARPGPHTVQAGSALVGWCCVWLVGVVGLWVGRWLRIAQWTRASCFLWLSCQGRTVDALAPGADEGRGRPR